MPQTSEVKKKLRKKVYLIVERVKLLFTILFADTANKYLEMLSLAINF
jgi:hypothetical protein